tara:strand:- start:65 stop:682 length:618 start_codon:yes stop_codon:yes gene_type:complete
MAKTIINLTDPVSTLVTKTNTVSSHLGDISQLNVGASFDSDIVQAINRVNSIASSTDSADIITLVQANSIDSSEALALIASDSGATNIMSQFIKDSANGIGFDSSQGRFFVPSNTINTAMIEPLAVTIAKIGADAVDGTKIADDAINSEHYVDGSIDTAHIADDQITEDKMADDAVGSAQLKSLSTLLIKDSSGSTLKTIHGAGA